MRAAWWDVPWWLMFFVPSGTYYCFMGHWHVLTTTGHPPVPHVLRQLDMRHPCSCKPSEGSLSEVSDFQLIQWYAALLRVREKGFRLSDPDLAVYLTSNLAVTLLNLWSASIYMWTELQSRKQSSWGSSWHHERVVFSFICRWSIARNLKPHLVEKKCQWWGPTC